ncbi:amino acid permease [Halopiger aswanensis]|uniref:Amino acid/polyamine/organocation transporter (APC superfamily) n=1 Tax=Halopiger aswanensis TaxID=148449 RepID=A0A3R7D9H6_9EURY|nr:amino acid permease [Halopiger aswanensis]RKD94784.1 amino acid/polyamine/organocation transporter (APC superfamily) [Halopiger aswanensis]
MSGSDDELAKDLGLLSAITIGIGTMIGAGIFVLPGTAVADVGPLAAATFVIGGITAMFTALSASELGTAMPKSGGAYFYINRALGPLFGSISGWANWLGLAFASSFYMYGFGEYVNQLVGAPALGLGPVTVTAAQTIGLVGAVLFIAVNYFGAKETGGLQIVIVVTLLAILAAFTVVGLLNADMESLQPIVEEGAMGEVLPVTALVFVSYLGFVQITSVAEEIKNPGRNLPLAVIGSVAIVTVVYALFLLVLLAAVPTELVADNETAVVEAAQLLFGQYEIFGYNLGLLGWGMLLFGGLLATASSANASILSSSRINFAMGREKIISPSVNEIHPRFGTPFKSILITGTLIVVFLLVGNIELLSTAGSVLHLIVYGLLNIALIVMREAEPPDYDPDFEVPFYPFVPIIGAVSSFALIAYIEPFVIALSAGLVVFAAGWYLLYSRTRVENAGVFANWILDRSEEMPDVAVSAANAARPANEEYTVVVPVSNPRTESELLELASVLAKANDGVVQAVHIVEVPDQTPLREGSEHIQRIDAESQALMEQVREDTETLDVPVDVRTVVSHRSFEEVFDVARREQADTVVMGWGPSRSWSAGRAERPLDELTHDLPCDFLVLNDRGLEPDRVLVPTAGGPDSDLSAEVACYLRDQVGSEITLLHVVDDESERADGEAFLTEWAADHGLADATTQIDTSGDIEAAIATASAQHSLVILGATERGLLSRLVRGSLASDVLEMVDCSVILAEKSHDRSIRQRLFGSGNDSESLEAAGATPGSSTTAVSDGSDDGRSE